MDRQELKTLLAKLQSELDAGQAIDESLRQSLLALDRDIQKVLAREGQTPFGVTATATATTATTVATDADDASLNERAQELEARFAAEHPYLASTLRDVMDSLGKMGI